MTVLIKIYFTIKMSRYKIILLNQSIMHNRNTISKDRYVMMTFICGQCHVSSHALPVHNYFRLSLWSSKYLIGTGIFGQKMNIALNVLCMYYGYWIKIWIVQYVSPFTLSTYWHNKHKCLIQICDNCFIYHIFGKYINSLYATYCK